ncbi:LON peptidase substrate-binding domain-containing protein [Afifella sp. H1R]|uniref:LON peptidase substrate-binding domain-containing protein n=1 Tax=Afifella sp. H1R TaxID=2908841 RepID=UPI001F439828|nr:LON peptidase substrate-binding domain-containing protein [Afifella sp. H1R]MCF1505152.1 LON peptidase substrate-binding domain-containing protein [Afifella sp. H1R]
MAIQAGNRCYRDPSDLPDRIPVFPLSGALLLPSGQLPLNIFEPRYVAMIDDALRGERLIGMIQPVIGCSEDCHTAPLCQVGCAGRLTQIAETGDGRYLVTLTGVSRFVIRQELETEADYRACQVCFEKFTSDFQPRQGEEEIDRAALLSAFRSYLTAHDLEADWESVERASNVGLLTALCMMSPWGPAEKQALLEAPSLKERAETLIAIAELSLAGSHDQAPVQ